MSLEIVLIQVTAFEQNCRLLIDPLSKKAVLFDPGGDSHKIIRFLEERQLHLEAIYLTHSHIDHCGGVAGVLRKFNCSLYGHRAEKVFRESVEMAAQMYGLSNQGLENCPEPDKYLEEGDDIEILGARVQVLHTPGHSPGSVSFYFKDFAWLFSGDVLFKSSIGRSDLPGGSHHTLIESINRLIKILPPDTRVFSGHGPDTELGYEAHTNPFLNQ